MLTRVTTMFAIINVSYNIYIICGLKPTACWECANVDIVSRLIEFPFSADYTLQLVIL